jgi:uncharacterized membrane protein YtjA (UPF0391 family)
MEPVMLHYAIVFFLLALIAAYFGFVLLAGTAAMIAKILFVLFLIFLVIEGLRTALKGRPPV